MEKFLPVAADTEQLLVVVKLYSPYFVHIHTWFYQDTVNRWREEAMWKELHSGFDCSESANMPILNRKHLVRWVKGSKIQRETEVVRGKEANQKKTQTNNSGRNTTIVERTI